MSQSNKPNMPNLPGFDAMADTFEFVKNMWGGMQTPSGVPGISMPTLSQEEINKQIADLKAVESWLNVNMTMLRGTIQALEVQSATISTLNAMGAAFGAEMKPNTASDNAYGSAQSAMGGAPFAHAFIQKDAPAADGNPLHAHATASATADATTAWWNALQTQFNQVVSSVMADEASDKKTKAAPAKPSAKTRSSAAKKSTVKSGTRATQTKTKPVAKVAAKKRTGSVKS